ncbi:dihydropteroate synthase [Acidocella sp.]|uniref:dihydropteroate synthase n=1 Tax=Acidocella sp. TaxID=50710 RepID=UPI00260F65A9|nr:dihydropteroate synthase [Acidocella sp.]
MRPQTQFWAGLPLTRPLVMGILNVTPDSFSDGGQHFDAQAAIAAGQRLREAGADILDIGGESTRPGSAAVTVAEEIARVVPVIAALAEEGAVISVDTRNAATMASALDAGARIINDISGLAFDPAARALAAARGCPVVLMHMRGTPQTMDEFCAYDDVVADVARELALRRDEALAAGIAPEHICLDPGYGFAKTARQNIELMRGIPALLALGQPLLVGVSRKRFIGQMVGGVSPAERDAGSHAAGLYACAQGAHIIRVHDVAGASQGLRVWQELSKRENG